MHGRLSILVVSHMVMCQIISLSQHQKSKLEVNSLEEMNNFASQKATKMNGF